MSVDHLQCVVVEHVRVFCGIPCGETGSTNTNVSSIFVASGVV